MVALTDLSISFNYSYSADTYDGIRVRVNGQTVVSKGGSQLGTGSYSTTLSQGDIMEWEYYANSPGSGRWNCYARFNNIVITRNEKIQVGTELKSIAKKVKNIYLGTTGPMLSITNIDITSSNISSYFNVANNSYYFAGSGNVFTSNNSGINSSTAQTILTALSDISIINFQYSYSSETNYDKFTLVVGDTTIENAVSGATTQKVYSGSLQAGQTIKFVYAKDGSTHSNNDKCTFSNMKITTQTETYKENVARKIKKAYIGIGGVARPCFPGGEPTRFGPLSMTTVRTSCAANSIGDYAIFAGGSYSSSALNSVEAYNSSLVQTIPTNLTNARQYLKSATTGDYVIFNSGSYTSGSTQTLRTGADAYNTNLTRTSVTRSHSYWDYGATSVGNYALFVGGTNSPISGAGDTATATAYNNSLTRSNAPSLNTAHCDISGATIANYAIFTGNQWGSAIIDVYNDSLTKITTSIAVPQSNRATPGAVSAKNYAIFAGGGSAGSTGSDHVDAYNASLTRIIASPLVEKRHSLASAQLHDYSLFMGGQSYNSSTSSQFSSKTVDIYDEFLTHSIGEPLGYERGFISAATTGNYAIVSPGYKNGVVAQAPADVYMI